MIKQTKVTPYAGEAAVLKRATRVVCGEGVTHALSEGEAFSASMLIVAPLR